MIKLIDKSLHLRYIISNLLISSLLILLKWYTGKFIKGILSYVGFILDAPSYIILFIILGPTKTLHFTSDKTFLIVSFVFYSIFIGLIQLTIYKLKKKRATDGKRKT